MSKSNRIRICPNCQGNGNRTWFYSNPAGKAVLHGCEKIDSSRRKDILSFAVCIGRSQPSNLCWYVSCLLGCGNMDKICGCEGGL